MTNKLKDISLLLFTGGQYCPNTLAPSHAGPAACSLSNPSVNHHRSNLPLGSIVSRLDSWLGQKTKIIFRSPAPESFSQFSGQRMIWRSPHPVQKAFFNPLHRHSKTSRLITVTTVQCPKQFFEPFEQEISPSGQFFNAVLSKETNLPNQMSHAILYRPHSSLDYMAPAAFAVKCRVAGGAVGPRGTDKE